MKVSHCLHRSHSDKCLHDPFLSQTQAFCSRFHLVALEKVGQIFYKVVCETKFGMQTLGEEPGNKATQTFGSPLCCFLGQYYTAVETATKALQLVNGYVMRGKPVIVSYGHGDSSS